MRRVARGCAVSKLTRTVRYIPDKLPCAPHPAPSQSTRRNQSAAETPQSTHHKQRTTENPQLIAIKRRCQVIFIFDSPYLKGVPMRLLPALATAVLAFSLAPAAFAQSIVN